MSNGLIGLDNSYLSNDMNRINNLQHKLDGNQKEVVGKSFKELFREKLNSDGSVNQAKLEPREKKLYDSCVEMESFLWKQMLNEMKKTINKHKLIDGGQAEEIFTDFLYDEYSMTLAKNANTKLSDDMFKQLSGYYK